MLTACCLSYRNVEHWKMLNLCFWESFAQSFCQKLYTLLQNKRWRWCGATLSPRQAIFEGQTWPQQTIYHWKGNLMASRIHFKYWKIFWFCNFMSNFCEKISQWLFNGSRKKFQTFKIWTYYIPGDPEKYSCLIKRKMTKKEEFSKFKHFWITNELT